mgnify:FL=1
MESNSNKTTCSYALPENHQASTQACVHIGTVEARRATSQRSGSGQASVEYAVVLVGFLALIIALGTLHSFLEDGALIEHALQSSSHAIERICSGTTKDVMCV